MLGDIPLRVAQRDSSISPQTFAAPGINNGEYLKKTLFLVSQGGVRNKIYDTGSDFFLTAQGLD